MPQLQLTPVGPAEMRDLRITISPPRTADAALQVVVAIERASQDTPMPVWVGSLPGIQADFLMTLVREAVSAWAYGEDARDVQRACSAVKRQARDHEHAHAF